MLPRLAIAARSGASMRLDRLEPNDPADPMRWASERIDRLYATGANGPLYVFIRDPPDAALADLLRGVTTAGRLHANIVAPARSFGSNQHLELLERSGVRTVYLTLRGATAEAHDAGAGAAGSWRRVLLLLTTAPRIFARARVGVHVALSPEMVRQLPGIFRVLTKVRGSELLLWFTADGPEWDASAALPALDFAVTAAAKLGIRIVPVGFEGARGAAAPSARGTCAASAAVVDLLRDGIPVPSASGGLFATAGTSTPIAEVASNGQAVRQLGFELAAGRRPLLDLPACLGGPPPADAVAPAGCVKVDACGACPIDRRCAGVPRPMMDIPGLRDQVRPPPHWLPVKEHARVLVMCGPVSDALYGATFFGLARWLARFGARVDVVTPWAFHEDIPFSWTEVQPVGRPDGVGEFERFMLEGPVDRYDLVVTPDPKVTRPLVVSRRLPAATRLVVTDFHMLGGMDEWVRDLCAAGRRAEEGGWWPSPEIILHSGFPGFVRLYERYGIPMQQVAWQPYVLDAASFPVDCAAVDGTSIVSGGNHRRDVDTLLAAAARLDGRVHRIDLFAHGEMHDLPSTIDFHGVVPTTTFCRTLSRSRFMIVPLLDDPHNAAGITAIVTGIMCGRPIVATATRASRDYVIDGVSGILVPPGDPEALADAIERVDRDPALLAELAAGAREAARHHTTESWARALLLGSGTAERAHWMWSQWRPPARP